MLLGLVLGPSVLGLMEVGLGSSALRVFATLGLALVLFTDAVTLKLGEASEHLRLASLILGPGTLLATGAMAVLAHYLLGLDWAASVVLAAALASTDPVMLRGLLHRRDLPRQARLGLRLESGLNDIVLLPILLVAMSFMPGGRGASMGEMLLELFVLGPVAGLVVGWASILALRTARARIGVRRDYESIYSLGVCFTAYAAGEALHGSGFLAAFAAGAVISALDPELCDCFIEYGETTAEMLLMFMFVLLGGSLIWSGFPLRTWPIVAFVALSLLARPIALWLSLLAEKMDLRSRKLIIYFGPRGLSTLLLALLPAFEGRAGSDKIFAVAGLVVLASVVVHGGSIMAYGRKRPTRTTTRLRVAAPRVTPDDENLLITVDELRSVPDVRLADVRSLRAYEDSDERIDGAVRVDPDDPLRSLAAFSPTDWIALFCT